MVILITTHLEPKDLMDVLIMVEKKLGRQRKNKNDPRTCDIDIIDYKRKVMNYKLDSFELTLPHKDIAERNFVLHPLKEICSDWTHPVTKKNIDVLIKNLKTSNNEITKLP